MVFRQNFKKIFTANIDKRAAGCPTFPESEEYLQALPGGKHWGLELEASSLDCEFLSVFAFEWFGGL